MNKSQRNSNRLNAEKLYQKTRSIRLSKYICENCGEPGGHWVSIPMTLEEIMLGLEQQGFWTCAKYYDESGKRVII